jgi:hypothetical protein
MKKLLLIAVLLVLVLSACAPMVMAMYDNAVVAGNQPQIIISHNQGPEPTPVPTPVPTKTRPHNQG